MFFDIFVDQWLLTSFAGGKRFHIVCKNVTPFLCCIIASLKGYKLEEMEDANTKLIARNGKWNLSRLLL